MTDPPEKSAFFASLQTIARADLCDLRALYKIRSCVNIIIMLLYICKYEGDAPRIIRANERNETMKKSIFRRAHAMTRDTIRAYPDADYRATFGAALRLAWKEQDMTPAKIWESWTEEEQTVTLWKNTLAEYRRRDARTTRDGKPLPNLFTWIDPAHVADDLRGVMAESWIRMDQYMQREDANDGTRTIGYFLRASIHTAAQYIGRMERRNARALRAKTDEDGNTTEYIIDNAAPIADPIATDPERWTITRDTIDRAANDDTDRAIIALTARGYVSREIARYLKIDHTTVTRRLEKIRARAAQS